MRMYIHVPYKCDPHRCLPWNVVIANDKTSDKFFAVGCQCKATVERTYIVREV